MMHCQHSFWFLPIIRSLRANYDNYFQWFCYHWTLFCVFRDQFPIMNLLFCEIIYMPFYTYLHSCCSVAQSCPTLCDPMDHSTPSLLVHHRLPEFNQTHVHWVGDAIQLAHSLSSTSPPVLNLSQHQGLFQWVSSSHQVAKVLEFQFQHQSFQWTPRTDLF